MSLKTKKTVKKRNSEKKSGIDNLTPFKKGESGNPDGRPKGQRNYKTIYREALIKLGELKGKTPDELEEALLSKAITKGLKGDFAFYKDVMDRIHNKATQPIGGPDDGPIEITVTKYAKEE